MLQTIFQIAFRGILRNWRQSFTAILSIAASFVSLTLFQGYMDDVQKMYVELNVKREMMGHLIIEDVQKRLIDPEVQARVLNFLNNDSRVQSKVRFLPVTGTISNGRSSMVFVGHGSDVAEGIRMRGKDLSWNAFAGLPLDPSMSEGLLIGRKLSNILGCEPNEISDFVQGKNAYPPKERPMNCRQNTLQLSVITHNGQMNAMALPLQGITDVIYKELDERFVALPLETAQALMDTRDVQHFSVRMKRASQKHEFNKELNKFFNINELPLKSVPWENHQLGELYNRTMDLLTIFRNFVVSVILVISSLSVFNTLLRNISERQKEIGTLRSIGFKPRWVRILFAIEAGILAAAGCLSGIVLALGLEFIINLLGITYKPGVFSSPVPFSISVGNYLIGQTSLFLCLLVVATAMVSVHKPLKKRITDCLNHV